MHPPLTTEIPQEYINLAVNHLNDILSIAFQYSPEQKAVVVYDNQCSLAIGLTEAYRKSLPDAKFINFYEVSPEEVMDSFSDLSPADLVVLIQSTSFRLDAFRLRVELFKQALKVIEHPHLARMTGVEANYYIESLAYDPSYFRNIGPALKNAIDHATSVMIDSGDEQLIFESGFEPAKLNIGDYTGMQNIGGQFPIGEVFTEARDLEAVNGRVRIFAFADTTFSVNKPEIPITLIIHKGRVTDVINSTPEFDTVLANIRADEGEIWLRELGLGMNRAFSPTKTVTDVGTYERVCGIHLSIGAKHGVYKKPQFKRGETWHHVDVFAITHMVYLDDK